MRVSLLIGFLFVNQLMACPVRIETQGKMKSFTNKAISNALENTGFVEDDEAADVLKISSHTEDKRFGRIKMQVRVYKVEFRKDGLIPDDSDPYYYNNKHSDSIAILKGFNKAKQLQEVIESVMPVCE